MRTLKRCKAMGLLQTKECFNSQFIYFLHLFAPVFDGAPFVIVCDVMFFGTCWSRWFWAMVLLHSYNLKDGGFKGGLFCSTDVFDASAVLSMGTTTCHKLFFRGWWWCSFPVRVLKRNSSGVLCFYIFSGVGFRMFHMIIIGENSIASGTDPDDSHDNSHADFDYMWDCTSTWFLGRLINVHDLPEISEI